MKRYAAVLAVLFTILCGSAQAQKAHKKLRARAKVTATTHFTLLTWTASVSASDGSCVAPCVIAYNVYRGTTAGGENLTAPINTAPVTATTFQDTTVALGSTYVYVVQTAEYPNGIAAGAPTFSKTNSNEVAVILARGLPAAPTELVGTPN